MAYNKDSQGSAGDIFIHYTNGTALVRRNVGSNCNLLHTLSE
jgi:hypothetical protein